MNDKKKRKRNIPITIAGIMLWLTLASAWLVCGLYAKYVAIDSESDSARPAVFVFRVNDGTYKNVVTHIFTLAEITKPGDSAIYAFVVKNSSGISVSEVSETYHIQVTLNGSIPLTATLTKDNDDLFTVNTTTDDARSRTASASGSFTPGNAGANSDSYKLTVTWPTQYMTTDFANGSGIATVTLTITGVQAD